jgi:type I restriction enzyme S subunit
MSSEWLDVRLEDCMDAIIDYRGKTPNKVAHGVPLITAKIVKDGAIEKPTEFVAESEYEAWMRRGLPLAGDVVLTTEAPLGEVAQLEHARVALAQRIILLRGNKDQLDNTFLRFLLQSEAVRSQLTARSSGTTVSGIKQSELRKVRLSLPPFSEQVEIAGVLRALSDAIQLRAQTNETLEAMARAIFKSWFVDFDPVRAKAEGREPEGMDADTAALFPSEFRESELGEIPLGWTVREVRDVSTSNRKSIGKNFAHDEIEYVDISSVEPGRITTSTMCNLAEAPSRAKRLVSDGDTIWSCVRPNRRSFALMMEPANNLVVSTGFVTLTATEVPFSFLYLSVTTSHFVEYLTLRADGAAYPAVRPDTFESAKVIVPSANILNRFHEIAEPMLRKIAANNEQAKTLATLRDTLLPRLISGKLQVPEAEAMLMGGLHEV